MRRTGRLRWFRKGGNAPRLQELWREEPYRSGCMTITGGDPGGKYDQHEEWRYIPEVEA